MSDHPTVVFSVPIDDHGMLHHSIAHFFGQAERACAQRGIEFRYNIHTGKPNTSTRNRQCAEFLLRHPDADYLCFCDSDALPDAASFVLLLDGIQRPEVDVLFGWSLMVQDGNEVIPNVTEKANSDGEAKLSRRTVHHEAPGLVEITGGGCGSHCMMLTRDVVQAFVDRGELWFEDHYFRDWSGDREKYGTRSRGHDYYLCHRAAEWGFRLWVDNRVYWGHAKTIDLRQWYNQSEHLQQSINVALVLVDMMREKHGNTDWTASSEFLLRMAIEANRLRPGSLLVELGAGLSTEVLSRCHDNVMSLEQDNPDHALTRLPGSTVEWYPLSLFDAVPDRSIAMLVVDGPRGDTPGGRSGVLEIREKVAPGAVVMFDDVNRAAEVQVVEAWCDGLGDVEVERVPCSDGRAFAVMRMP